jgi:hypothetical protein
MEEREKHVNLQPPTKKQNEEEIDRQSVSYFV